ncbi:hypothetical protein NEFER03_0391 [Nematocida sp. LUAm3]|nr:hypothetical protein NEFER03_0391 [Nematocida sp. LUAm3]KAI5175993.1 hypothetical protein NEFER02_1839 [Nematocida sp. LUAm2]KAI5179089.1 hypothetical protein NEFER01_1956 [Nematocida sp. LUAm1]
MQKAFSSLLEYFKRSPIQKTELKNGITLVTKEMYAKGICWIGIFLNQGSTAESSLSLPEGSLHMLEHVLIDGIPEQEKSLYKINGISTKNYLSISGYSKTNSQSNLLSTLINSLNKPISPHSLIKEKQRVTEEELSLKKRNLLQIENIFSSLYKNSPLNTSILGSKTSRDLITISHLEKLLKYSTTKNNLIILALGDIIPSQLTAQLNKIPPLPNPPSNTPTTTPSNTPSNTPYNILSNTLINTLLNIKKYITNTYNSTYNSTYNIQLKKHKYSITHIPNTDKSIIAYKIPKSTNKNILIYLFITKILENYLKTNFKNSSISLITQREGSMIYLLTNTKNIKTLQIKNLKQKILQNYKSQKSKQIPISSNSIENDSPYHLFWNLFSGLLPPQNIYQSNHQPFLNITKTQLEQVLEKF